MLGTTAKLESETAGRGSQSGLTLVDEMARIEARLVEREGTGSREVEIPPNGSVALPVRQKGKANQPAPKKHLLGKCETCGYVHVQPGDMPGMHVAAGSEQEQSKDPNMDTFRAPNIDHDSVRMSISKAFFTQKYITGRFKAYG